MSSRVFPPSSSILEVVICVVSCIGPYNVQFSIISSSKKEADHQKYPLAPTHSTYHLLHIASREEVLKKFVKPQQCKHKIDILSSGFGDSDSRLLSPSEEASSKSLCATS
jgi:hypothetical protein